MANFNGRRVPNVSQYLANLNTIPTTQELQQQDLPLADDNLDFLTNAEFFDFDQFNPAAFPQQQPPPPNGAHGSLEDEAKNAGQNFQFAEFQTFPATNLASPSSSMASPSGLHGTYPPQPHHFAPSPVTGDMRKASVAQMPTSADLEEASRMAAEEDKRRRNTAASARFRVKKKQREQALEKQTKDMSDKVTMLESKVQQLEMENKWLKELITDKNDGKSLDAALEAKRGEKKTDERSTDSRTDGVGTPAPGTGVEGEA